MAPPHQNMSHASNDLSVSWFLDTSGKVFALRLHIVYIDIYVAASGVATWA